MKTRLLASILIALALCAGCATTGQTVKLNEQLMWSIAVSDIERFDMNGDQKLDPAELVPSFQEQILPICDRVIASSIPPDAVTKSEEMQEALQGATTELSGYFAKSVFTILDTDLDGLLSQQEIAALEGKPIPFNIKFTLTLKE